MSVDVNAVNERLNGLVTLLKAVGVDTIDKGEMDRVSKDFSSNNKGGTAAAPITDARQLNDDQIEAIIRKLQLAQAEAPQIIAALEAHAEARSLNGGGRGAGGGGNDHHNHHHHHQQHPQQHQHHHEEEDDDEDEEDDEFDEDANYPMVGHGVSDDISVVSDLTTPTVLTGVPVPEEEHYRETLPPMIVGGGPGEALPPMMIQPPKRKNLVNQVGRGGGGGGGGGGGIGMQPPRRAPGPGVGRAGGAAAARRKNYQETMAKLHENPHNMAYVGPSAAQAPSPAPHAPPSGGKKSSKGSKSSKDGTKRRSAKPRGSIDGSGMAAPDRSSSGSGEWKYDGPPSKPRKPTPAAPPAPAGPAPTVIDDDGFLVGQTFDPFNSGSNPFHSKAGELANHDREMFDSNKSVEFDAFGNAASNHNSPRKAKKKSGSHGQGSGTGKKERTTGQVKEPRPRRSRRASTNT